MYQVTVKLTRPSLDVPFYDIFENTTPNNVWRPYWISTYRNTELCLSVTISTSVDELIKTWTFVWKDMDAWQTYLNDPIVVMNHVSVVQAYNSSNGIISERTEQELIV